MIIIALKTTFVNLIISALSCLSELLALSALLAFLTNRECTSLAQGNKVSVLHSKRRRRQLQACALIVFVALEILLVFGVRPYSALRPVSCIAIDTSLRFESEAHPAEAESAAVDCRTLDRGLLTEHNATYSIDTGTIRCGPKPLFHFRLNSTNLFTTPLHVQQPSAHIGAIIVSCASKFVSAQHNKCLLILSASNAVYISDLLYTSPPTQFANVQNLPFSQTVLPYQVSPKQITYIGVRAANTLLEGIREPMRFRHRVFSGFSKQTCTERDGDPLHTQVNTATLAVLIMVWVLCFLTYAVLYWAKLLTASIFDMRDPMHWAERTFRVTKAPLKKDVVLRLIRMGGSERVLVCHADDITFGTEAI